MGAVVKTPSDIPKKKHIIFHKHFCKKNAFKGKRGYKNKKTIMVDKHIQTFNKKKKQ